MILLRNNDEETPKLEKIFLRLLKKKYDFISNVSINEIRVNGEYFSFDIVLSLDYDFVHDNTKKPEFFKKGWEYPMYKFNESSKNVFFNPTYFSDLLGRIIFNFFHDKLTKAPKYSQYNLYFELV